MNKTFFFFFYLYSLFGTSQNNKAKLSYLALGDSYTIGESVETQMRWPNILADSLNKLGHNLAEPIIIAKTGWRTDELIQAIKENKELGKFNLVSLLIGVNNQYQGKDIDVFKKELKELIQLAIQHSINGPSGVFAVSIPDYGVTPFAQSKNQDKISREIKLYNSIYQEICEQQKVSFFDITPISQEADTNLKLLATDGLHPSGLMYQRWVSLIMKEVDLLHLNK